MNFKNYIYSHCVSPISINRFNPATGVNDSLLVPCGKCLHCRNQLVNEWVTRLYAHAKYSKYVYFVTLDYSPFSSSDYCRDLIVDTAATYHNLNINHSYGLHPILLCKSHLQKFFKRLRKNNPNLKFEYFACGEYGHKFGRPHFHIILFAHSLITIDMLQNAWSVYGYKIGNVDFHDLKQNGSFDKNSNNAKYVFKYVCKYLQKNQFNWEEIPTLSFHRSYFESISKVCSNPDELFQFFELPSESDLSDMWKVYCKKYSPFTCCSKRPSIGLQYFKENLERFQTQDFRLFGLQKECTAFPRYYIRKTKESLCLYDCIGKISGCPSSSSCVPRVVSLLCQICDINRSIDNWNKDTFTLWNSYRGKVGELKDGIFTPLLDISELHIYDRVNRLFYVFNGFDYSIWCKHKNYYSLIDHISIDDFIVLLNNGLKPYLSFVNKLYLQKIVFDKQLNFEINRYYGSSPQAFKLFKEDVYRHYCSVVSLWNCNKIKINNTKITY